MDEVDQKLLAALRRDGRASLSELAALLGVTRATVRTRMQRMVAQGDIAGFTVMTRADISMAPVRALMMIRIEGRGFERIAQRLAGIVQVTSVHSTNGRWDLIVEIASDTLVDLDGVLQKIRDIDGVAASETSLLLSTRRAKRG